MAYSLAPVPAAVATPICTSSPRSRREIKFQILGFQKVSACHQDYREKNADCRPVQRRSVSLGLAGALLGLNINHQSANAAARRPPPPPSVEKKDPSMTALQAKIFASKKRRAAMKEEVTRLRERGKPNNVEPSD